MVMKRVTRPFRQLQGKLTLSYTLNSVVTFLFIEVTLIIIILGYVNLNISGLVLNNLKLAISPLPPLPTPRFP